jgi:chromosome segregation ATPase
MKEKVDKPNVKEETRALRKKTKRIEESRASIKTKSREKGKVIKAHQDRLAELEKNRDDWKAKCKEQEKERINANDKYKQVAALLQMKEEQLREILKEFEESKKKHPTNYPR